ncbi:hypothetical protein QBC34DRAFT_26428 [Podospora aff. communis PSN243]|uniref:NADH:flavin oxidoreductase/NADH oxidase N-terminal domain-containing protein n=1 Tax=Podospora aff. communis PSN243 TaxID=3040156 RepID=A0AAV9GUA6_9PEZI|nr:hypothetical protein QBC34DRAFT_26428 [Podospora aff. communis PSN243]
MTSRPRFPSAPTDPTPLAQPLHFPFSNLTAKNRFHKSPITERLSTWHPTDLSARGIPTPELINVYRRWGQGGFGTIATGNVMIDPLNLEAAGNPIIPLSAPFSGERFDRFREMAAAAKAEGSLCVVQLSHAGRQAPANIQPHPVSASDVHLAENAVGGVFAPPRALTREEIREVVNGFAHAAEFCYRAGFDGVELHGAHGYLLAQFLAQGTNKREDEYGGLLSNRARIVMEIVREVKRRVPEEGFMVGIKINSVEFQKGGFGTEECRWLCGELQRQRLDFVELSGGTYEVLAFEHKRESSRRREAYFLEFADMIVPQLTKTRAYVTGGLRTVSGMVRALETVHGVGLARPVCHEFDLPKRILSGEAQGAIDYLLDDQDYLLTDVAAGTQVKIVGYDKAPLDMTQQSIVDSFNKSMAAWFQQLTTDTTNSFYGWVDVDEELLQPYGTPYKVVKEKSAVPDQESEAIKV